MKLSELYAAIPAAGDILSYAAWLAAPDKDGTDVDLAAVARVSIAAGEIRLYPASTATDTDSVEPEPFLGIVLSQMPLDPSGADDPPLRVEVPLLRDESGSDAVAFADISSVHIGRESREVWLLARPAAEFAAGLLPA